VGGAGGAPPPHPLVWTATPTPHTLPLPQ